MRRILYVEDNDDNIYMLRHRLERRGFVVSIATDGQAGVDSAIKELPDLILLDLGLPVLDGWEVACRLKADERTRTIPIIALSAHAMADDRGEAIGAGCDDYDTKPIDLARLLGKIRALLPPEAGP
jgi:two-component system cell cycle response regulator DivK